MASVAAEMKRDGSETVEDRCVRLQKEYARRIKRNTEQACERKEKSLRVMYQSDLSSSRSISRFNNLLSPSIVDAAGVLRRTFSPFAAKACLVAIPPNFFCPRGLESSAPQDLQHKQSHPPPEHPDLPTDSRKDPPLHAFVPRAQPSDGWKEPLVSYQVADAIPRDQIFGNTEDVDDVFSIFSMRGYARGALALVLLSGPCGSGKTLICRSAAKQYDRRCVIVDATELSRRTDLLCKALTQALSPSRDRMVVFRCCDLLEEDQVETIASYFRRNVISTPRRHNLCVFLAQSSGCCLFRVFKGDEELGDSRLCRSVYLHRPTPPEVEAAAIAWGWDAAKEGVPTFQLVQRAGGDMRILRGLVERGGLWFRAGRENAADQASDPFVLVPALWNGIAGELAPVDLRGPSRGIVASALAEVVHEGMDIFQENYLRALRVGQHQHEIRSMEQLADMLSTADLLSVWREGDGETGDEDYMAGQFGAEVMVASCANLRGKWKPVLQGCRASSRYAHAKELQQNLELMQAQRMQSRLAARPALVPVGETVLDCIDRTVETKVLKHQQGLVQLTAQQMLDWPVCLQR
jgi:hypothetical protein